MIDNIENWRRIGYGTEFGVDDFGWVNIHNPERTIELQFIDCKDAAIGGTESFWNVMITYPDEALNKEFREGQKQKAIRYMYKWMIKHPRG